MITAEDRQRWKDLTATDQIRKGTMLKVLKPLCENGNNYIKVEPGDILYVKDVTLLYYLCAINFGELMLLVRDVPVAVEIMT